MAPDGLCNGSRAAGDPSRPGPAHGSARCSEVSRRCPAASPNRPTLRFTCSSAASWAEGGVGRCRRHRVECASAHVAARLKAHDRKQLPAPAPAVVSFLMATGLLVSMNSRLGAERGARPIGPIRSVKGIVAVQIEGPRASRQPKFWIKGWGAGAGSHASLRRARR
jgi:hypothetical protein